MWHSHVSVVSTPFRWIFKNALEKAVDSCRITRERSESAREQRIALYKKRSTIFENLGVKGLAEDWSVWV